VAGLTEIVGAKCAPALDALERLEDELFAQIVRALTS